MAHYKEFYLLELRCFCISWVSWGDRVHGEISKGLIVASCELFIKQHLVPNAALHALDPIASMVEDAKDEFVGEFVACQDSTNAVNVRSLGNEGRHGLFKATQRPVVFRTVVGLRLQR